MQSWPQTLRSSRPRFLTIRDVEKRSYCEFTCNVCVTRANSQLIAILSDTSDSSELRIEVYFKHHLRDDTFEGRIEESVKSLLEAQGLQIP